MLRISFLTSPKGVFERTLLEFPVTIGRDPSNTITVDDPEMSRFHVRIKNRGKLYIIEDLDSKNGSFLNGDRIINSILRSGDRLHIGSCDLVFSYTSDVTFALSGFSASVDEEQGIEGSINLPAAGNSAIQNQSSGRIRPFNAMNKVSESLRNARLLFSLESNIMTSVSIEDGATSLLKGLAQLTPLLSRSVFFLWEEERRKLSPLAHKQFHPHPRPFSLSKRMLAEVIASKEGVVLSEDPAAVTKVSQGQRVIFPVLAQPEELIGVIHCESDKGSISMERLELMQTLIHHGAPSLLTFLLRRELDSFSLGFIETMIATIEAKDTYTMGHSERVCRYAMAIAEELRLDRNTKKMLMISALCHDIGKVGIPDAILKKASLLSNEEYDEMKLHPVIGANIMANLPNAQKFLSGIRSHHEKWDGTGYPEGLQGEHIPFFGRIVAVGDVFDAMVSGRSYSGFLDESDAIDKINKEAELFDPEILKALTKAWEKGLITQRTSTIPRSK